jgi:antitoxin MazE
LQTRIGRWGHSLALRIPHALVQEAHLVEGTPVELTVTDGRLVVTPVQSRYRLDDLLAAVTPDNCHAETDWGPPVGREVW